MANVKIAVNDHLVSTSRPFPVELDSFTKAFDYDASDHLIYQGVAIAGTLKGSVGWKISKLTYAGDNLSDIQWASGDTEMNKVWNSRIGYTYS